MAVAVRDSLSELFDSCVNSRPLHLGLARHLLRRATSMRTAVISDRVFNTLEILSPVFRDVGRYIISSVPNNSAEARGRQLQEFLAASDVGALPFLRMWGLEILQQRPEMASGKIASGLAEDSAGTLGVRYRALTALKYGQLDWVRAQKETWRNHGAWDRRAIIWSSCALPASERRPWLEIVRESPDVVDRAVAKFAASQS
jgi:hypothetical protein